jgi:hypothetical protein
MAPPLYNGFETGTSGTTLSAGSGGNTAGGGINYLDGITAGTGTTVAFSNAFAAHGSLSAKIATGSTATAAYMEWAASLGTVTTHYGRAYLYLTAAPGTSDAFIRFQDSTGAHAAGVQLTTAQHIVLQDATSASVHTFATTVSTGTWWRVEWELISGAGTGQITVSLYALDSATATETYTSSASQALGANCASVRIGWTGSHASQPAVYVDDIGISTSGFLGPAGSLTVSGGAALSGSGSLALSAGAFGGTAHLTGSGTLGSGPAGYPSVYAATYTGAAGYSVLQDPVILSGTGTLTGSGNAGVGALLTGSGTFGAARVVTWEPGAALSGSGVLSAAYFQSALSGTGTLGISGVQLSYPLALSGTGTLAVLQVLGGLVSASAGASTPYAYPGTSQVAVAPPGSTAWQYLGSLGVVTALTYSFTCPGGCDAMTCTVMVPASYRTQLFNPGWQVRITRGGHQVWDGRLDEPVPTASGWNLTAVGAGNRGTDFLAVYSGTWPSGQPDASINAAIARGLAWANPGVGTPSGAWYGQGVDSGAQTITALLNLICTRGGLTWMVNSQPGGVPGDDLSVFPLPTVVNRLLVCTTPVARTLGGDINTIYIRYEISPDTTSGTTSVPAVYGTTIAQNAASVAAHGEMETYIDLSDVGVMSAGAAQAVGQQVLSIYQRASFAGPFTGSYGQLLTTGGTPIDPGTDQAGTCMRPILTDYGYGGEVTPQFPVQFITGSYSWDDFTQQFSAMPYVSVDQSLTGLLSLTNTEMTPITVAGP